MPDDEKIPLIEYHFLNPVKCTSISVQKNAEWYVDKLTWCNICIIINILGIFLIRTAIGVLDLLKSAAATLEMLITIVVVIMATTYIFLICLFIVNQSLIRKLLAISKQFNIHTNKICTVLSIILIIIDLSLYISCYAISSDIGIIILFILSTIIMFSVCVVIGIEAIYINLKF